MKNVAKELKITNLMLITIVFCLLVVAFFVFLYVLLQAYSHAPTYTGTASDIIIALTNCVIATAAILAIKNIDKIFKEKTHDFAINKIDNLLSNLDRCVDSFGTFHVNLIGIKICIDDKDFYSQTFENYNNEIYAIIKKAMDSNSEARVEYDSISRWNTELNEINGATLDSSLAETLEMCILMTSIFLSIKNKKSEHEKKPSFARIKDFSLLHDDFDARRIALNKTHEEFKKLPVDSIFKLRY